MSWQKFLIELLDVLAWPSVILAVCITFKKEFVFLLKRLSSISGKGWQVDFNTKIKETREKTREANLPEITANEEKDLLNYYKELARVSPDAVIIEAWKHVETFAQKAIGIEKGEYVPLHTILRLENRMEELGISTELIILFGMLRAVRNNVAYKYVESISEKQAVIYANSAIKLAVAFDRIAKKRLAM